MGDTNLQKLVTIMDELRTQCPWDKKQTIHSLRQQTIEELYELTDAIDSQNWQEMREELGDVLLHIVFYAKIADEQGHFNIQDVIDDISEKLVRRHPHIYGDAELEDAEAVLKNWERIKRAEGKKSVMSGLPSALPALSKAVRIQQKAAQIGFEWKDASGVWEKVEEEKREMQQALDDRDHQAAAQEAGDLLFSIVNYIRFCGIDAEYALELTNKKFIDRFKKMEERALADRNQPLSELTLGEMDEIWNQIKSNT